MKINVQAVLAREKQRQEEVKPQPKVIMQGSAKPSVARKPAPKRADSPKAKQLTAFPDEKEIILKDLWEDITRIKKERAKLSSGAALLVDQLYERLKLESPEAAAAFMRGDLPMPDLADRYESIQDLTDQAIVVWDKIKYVEQYGKLPEVVTVKLPESSPDEDAIRHEIRRLDDLIHKSMKKIEQTNGGIKKPKNNDRVNTWREKISLAEARRDDLKHKLKRMQYEARAKRAGEE